MSTFILVVEDVLGKVLARIDDRFNTYEQIQEYVASSEDGSVFKIFEDRPFLWDLGDHIRGTKKPNGRISWVRVPFAKS